MSYGWACAAALIAALVTACAGGSDSKHAQVNQGGYSESFRQGYTEGCESSGGGFRRRDDGRYKTEADYMMGWNDGFSACRKSR